MGWMRRIAAAVCAVGALGGVTSAAADDEAHPKVGLVLSGGGARGGAHIGVLKVLEELNVPVDIVVGTSAGAIVAAAYATGMPLSEIEAEMKGLSTSLLLHDVDRSEVPLNSKIHDSFNYIGPEVGIQNGSLALPKGAVAGVSLEAVLRRLTHRQRTDNFDRLPIPFRAVATDLATAEMVVLSRGNLAQAIRASMAIPAVIEPVELDGRLLVDGGPSRNLPVDVARAMGAEVIIAVNIGTPLLKREEIKSLLSVSDQMTRILTNTNVAKSVSEIGPDDILLIPDLGTVTTADFDRLSEAAAAGEAAARLAIPDLMRYAIDGPRYAAWRASTVRSGEQAPFTVAEVRVKGTERVNPEVVTASMHTKAGDTFDVKKADADIKRIYARGDFEGVAYTVSEEPGVGHVLTAEVTEKSWGPQYLRFGLGLSSDLKGNSFFNLAASHRATWLNHLGAEWRNDVQIGHTDRLATEWYQPLTAAQRLFVAARAEFTRNPFDLYDNSDGSSDGDGSRIGQYRVQYIGVGLDLGTPIGRSAEFRVGLTRGHVKMLLDTGLVPPELLQPPQETGGVLARLRFDSLDSIRFPTQGWQGEVRLYASRPTFGADETYTKASANLNAAQAFGRHSLQVGLRGAKALGDDDLPVHELYSLGGFLRLSGYATGQFLGRELAFGRLVYNYRLSLPGFLSGAFIGASAEVGRIGDSVSKGGDAFTRHGFSIYASMDTPLGPIYGAFGRGGDGANAVYLYLGQP
ncbi:patatin-like phospholipase family protein [Piscinibacter gummiphilus]|nr:patatin-like phospholipase family protein [Piscinibacter gummiphilus]GLS95954.1 OMP85 family outer membrane protein [Piscinibacter gummiphilus]